MTVARHWRTGVHGMTCGDNEEKITLNSGAALSRYLMHSHRQSIAMLALIQPFFHYAACWKTRSRCTQSWSPYSAVVSVAAWSAALYAAQASRVAAWSAALYAVTKNKERRTQNAPNDFNDLNDLNDLNGFNAFNDPNCSL